MKTLAAVVAFAILSASSVLANGTPVTYLLWPSSFTAGQRDSARGYGYSRNAQPSKVTREFQPPNTNYVMITIATTSASENAAVQSLIAQGKIQPLSSMRLMSAYDGRVGGNVSWVDSEDCKSAPGKYVCFPQDWDKDWAVQVSCP